MVAASPARALSEIKRENMPDTTDTDRRRTESDAPIEKQTLPPIGTVPIPDKVAPPAADQPADPNDEDEVSRATRIPATARTQPGRKSIPTLPSPKSSTTSASCPNRCSASAR